MRKLIIILTALFALTLTSTGRAQSLYESAEKVRVEVGALQTEKLINRRETMRLAEPLSQIFDSGMGLTVSEDRQPLGQRCERAIRVSELFANVQKLKTVRIKSRRARERLKPLLEGLQSAVQGYGPGDEDKSCARLKGAV